MTRSVLSVCLAALAAVVVGFDACPARAHFLLSIPGVTGASQIEGYEGWIPIDSVDFSVERELKESGEKGGTEDINIGIGELSEFRMTKPTDAVSTRLFGFAINGNSVGTADVVLLSDSGDKGLAPSAIWRFGRAFVKDYHVRSAGLQLRDEFSFYFNKIAFAVADERGGFAVQAWDTVNNLPWDTHGLPGDYKTSAQISGLSGDFNGDGRVDAADYTLWRDNQSSTFQPEDYDLWRYNYGPATVGPAAASIPEPHAVMTLLLALSGWPGQRRKR